MGPHVGLEFRVKGVDFLGTVLEVTDLDLESADTGVLLVPVDNVHVTPMLEVDLHVLDGLIVGGGDRFSVDLDDWELLLYGLLEALSERLVFFRNVASS